MAAGFSRLQLAAALLEYDNDPDDPYTPKRSAHDSAIFANFRRYLPSNTPRPGDYLGVSLSGDGVSTRQAHSIADHRQSKASLVSINTLQNPFGHDDQIEEEDESGEGLEVDLASWGLDAFIPKDKADKASRNAKGKTKSTELLSPHSVSSITSHQPLTSRESTITAPRRALGASRSMSVGGNLEYFGTEERNMLSSLANRRRSVGALMDSPEMDIPPQRRRASSYTPLSTTSPPSSQLIPFPTTYMRSASNMEDVSFRPTSFSHQLEITPTHERAISNAGTMDPKLLPKNPESNSDARQRILSNATLNTLPLADDNPFALRAPSHTSRFDPKAAAYVRTLSNASMTSQPQIDDDAVSTEQAPNKQEPRYSTTLDLLRPKVLVMPSPLQPVSAPTSPPVTSLRSGFQLSTDGPPLPPGARSARRSSVTLSILEPPAVASNSFTPNPLTSLSLSQMTFRNPLRIGAEGDGYTSGDLPRATEDGEQIHLDDDELEQPQITVIPDVDNAKGTRPAGKLYGKSLIDDLEDRKAKMRSKQRVFTGDERPSMMARGTLQRSSTLIDPATLKSRPPSQHMPSYGLDESREGLKRRNSGSVKPLLNFDEDNKAPGPRVAAVRSVFGVDTLWEREMVKLRDLEAQEKAEEEDGRKKEAAENGKKRKKSKRKTKNRANPEPEVGSPAAETPRVSMDPPVLPDIQRAPRRAPHQVENDSESERSAEEGPGAPHKHNSDPDWHVISSDEDDPRRMTGTGPRYPNTERARQIHATHNQSDDDDVPLSVAVRRVGQTPSILHPGGADSDDERPLSTLLRKKQSSLFPDINFDNVTKDREDDDDDRPLGLRVSRIGLGSQFGVDDDYRPLAFHSQQQHGAQYQMMAQQQQLILQAQMQNSAYFHGAPMMGTPFFAPPMLPMMMQAPIPVPSPPPIQDEAKFGRVDRWRHIVAVEGDQP